MNLEDFKKIFWMEWAHRQVGRFIGLAFVVPAGYFIARGHVSGRMAARLGGIGALIGTQGLIGWLMVKSGLEDSIVTERAVPRVSHYRLATHLGTAFLIYLSTLWTSLTLLTKPRSAEVRARAWQLRLGVSPHTSRTRARVRELAQTLNALAANPALRRFRLLAAGTAGLVFVTAMSGTVQATGARERARGR